VSKSEHIRLLVLHAHYTTRLSYNNDWLDAFMRSPLFTAHAINIVKTAPADITQAMHDVDGVVLLHSTNADTLIYLEPYAKILSERRVPLLSFVGNEVNLPGSPIAEKRRILEAIKPDWIATQLLKEAGDFLFGDIVRDNVVAIPHALNPKAFAPRRAIDNRPIDIGARSVKYTPHLGDNDRNRIHDFFERLGEQGQIKVDISDQRFNRSNWAEFLNQCRATVSCEAGSWFIEQDDVTVNAIREFIFSQSSGLVIANDSPLRRLGHKMPWPLRRLLRKVLGYGPLKHEMLLNEQADYEQIYRHFFAGRAKPSVYGKCISSRHFDAAGTKTMQILFPGRYNDILIAGKHYFPLAPDFSNVDEALDRLRDLKARKAMVDETYDFILQHHTYEHRMQQVHKIFTQSRSCT
jgi:hypothetical protein